MPTRSTGQFMEINARMNTAAMPALMCLQGMPGKSNAGLWPRRGVGLASRNVQPLLGALIAGKRERGLV